MKKLLFSTSTFNFDNFPERSLMEGMGFKIVLNPNKRRLNETEILELLDKDVVGIVAGTELLTRSIMQQASSLKVISRCGSGLDNIDLEAASQLGISVFSTPDAPVCSVAELTIGHIICLSRHIIEADRMLRKGIWEPLIGTLISNQTIGIIGMGRIGTQVAKLLLAFDAKILAFDTQNFHTNQNIKFTSLENLLKESDIISLHLPYNAATHHILNAKTLGYVKKNSLIINVARGGLIDEEALYNAVIEGRIRGAALDCFSNEPYNGRLLSCEGIQFSPHIGSYTKETRSLMEKEACAALIQGLKQHALVE